MIRVLELLTTTTIGGGPRQVWDLARRLPAGEFTLSVAGPRDGPFFDRFRAAGFDVVELAAGRLGVRPVVAAARLVRARAIDVVHSHGKGAGLYGRLAARVARVPAVHTFHGIHYEGYAPPVRRPYLALERWLARRRTHTLIHVSASEAQEAAALGLAPPGRAVTIVNGIDVEEFDQAPAAARAALGLAADALVLGCVARNDPVKRLDLLVEVLARLAPRQPRARLLLAGPARGEARLAALARARGVPDRVVVADAAGGHPYGAMDLYVAASRKEGLPLALLEAMAAGLAVVATDVPGHRDVVRHGETGLLTAPDDPAALAGAIAALLDDPERRARMGRAGRARVAAEFTAARMAAETAEVYRRAAAARGRPTPGAAASRETR